MNDNGKYYFCRDFAVGFTEPTEKDRECKAKQYASRCDVNYSGTYIQRVETNVVYLNKNCQPISEKDSLAVSALQNAPFCIPKQHVSESKTGRFRRQNRTFCNTADYQVLTETMRAARRYAKDLCFTDGHRQSSAVSAAIAARQNKKAGTALLRNKNK